MQIECCKIPIGVKDEKELDLLKIGVAFVLFASIATASFLHFKDEGANLSRSSETEKEEADTSHESEDNEVFWDIYKNDKYGYAIAKPKLLSGREYENQGGYLHFIRFEENKFSRGKGVAVGVSGMGLDEQKEAIKKDIGGDENAILVSERAFEADGKSTYILEYDSVGEGEGRAVVIIKRGDYSYTISTTPDQMEHVLANLRFF